MTYWIQDAIHAWFVMMTKPPLVVVNKVGLPQAALPTFLNFPHSHAFRNGGPWMVWDSHSSNMKKPNVDEKE
jgi:hypothetical protein